ncbi:MAG TPA: amino acid adenylation domain-containing protein [Actinocrinis sp.]|jgi:amino acid adenylation domain-containing protein|uniref:amino acid adenylation domain-containing protein n=1 Tax=Actinocrinis sp. TaxID=1920516 RepID=UPI002DDCC1B4|nr:amino acid adenylation domain-containing protein [Actinocrinis sp.]HEV3171579.1 amino acid adenylation domain-containing protein [Actinocrinis sp.]
MSPTGPTSVTDLFRRQVVRTPDAVALEAGSDRLTYAELDAWSDELARLLLDRHGVVRGDRVAVCLDRSPRLIAALLGVLKAGAAYLPIDVAEPERRMSDMIADAEPVLAVCEPGVVERFAAHGLATAHVAPQPAVGADAASAAAQPPLPLAAADDIAYLMYTSGSTGRPKAVVVEHRNITNLVTEPNYVELAARDRILQLAPVAFDAATFEIWGALLNGARLVLAPPGQVQSEELGELLREKGITVLWLTAALFHRQIDADPEALAGLHTVLAGGDVLSVPHIRELREAAPGLQIVNGYGPTETTTFACCHRIAPDEELNGTVPIGRQLQNVVVRIVDPDGKPVPDGTAGELWIGGGGVSRGYWRRPELTAEKFVTAVGGALDGGRYYRSGDQARRRPDGVVEFLGRLDDQFKLRGFRIEPGEIENALAEHPQVRTAAVGIRESHLGDRRLVAWIVPNGETLDKRALREHLRERVPEHMIPAGFVSLTELPITANGKTDRRALPEPDWRSKALYV